MPIAAGTGQLDRRALLAGAVGSATALLLRPLTASAQNPVASAGTITAAAMAIADGLDAIVGLGGNVVVLTTAEGAVVVDSGAARWAGGLAGMISERTGGTDVTTLFNTHWHLDQVGGNALLRERGASIIAHAKTRAHLSIPYYLPDEDRYQEPLPAAGQPTDSFHTGGSLDIGGEQIDYGYLIEAHTDGDIYVRFAGRNVIAAGDAISPERDPVFDWFGGGWLGGRIDSLELLLAISDSRTRFVPSYGPVVDRRYVEAEHELMLALYGIMFARVRAGESAADIEASGALDALPRRFDNPGKLLYDVHKGIWAHYNTISPDIV